MEQPIVATSAILGAEASLANAMLWNIREEVSSAFVSILPGLQRLGWEGTSSELVLGGAIASQWTGYWMTPGLWGPAVTPLVEATLSALRLDRVTLPQPSQVRDYLLRFPEIAPLLPAVSKVVRESVEQDAEILLQVYRDPEIRDEYLTIYVRPSVYDETSLNAIDSIGSRFQDAIASGHGWLVITTDFRPRR